MSEMTREEAITYLKEKGKLEKPYNLVIKEPSEKQIQEEIKKRVKKDLTKKELKERDFTEDEEEIIKEVESGGRIFGDPSVELW